MHKLPFDGFDTLRHARRVDNKHTYNENGPYSVSASWCPMHACEEAAAPHACMHACAFTLACASVNAMLARTLAISRYLAFALSLFSSLAFKVALILPVGLRRPPVAAHIDTLFHVHIRSDPHTDTKPCATSHSIDAHCHVCLHQLARTCTPSFCSPSSPSAAAPSVSSSP